MSLGKKAAIVTGVAGLFYGGAAYGKHLEQQEMGNRTVAEVTIDLEAKKSQVVADCLGVAQLAVQAAVEDLTDGVDSSTGFTKAFKAINGIEGETAGQEAMDACEISEAGLDLDANVNTSAVIVDGSIQAQVVQGQ